MDWFELMQYVDERDTLNNKKKWALACERLQKKHPEW